MICNFWLPPGSLDSAASCHSVGVNTCPEQTCPIFFSWKGRIFYIFLWIVSLYDIPSKRKNRCECLSMSANPIKNSFTKIAILTAFKLETRQIWKSNLGAAKFWKLLRFKSLIEDLLLVLSLTEHSWQNFLLRGLFLSFSEIVWRKIFSLLILHLQTF